MPRIQFIGKDEQILRTIKVLCKGYHIVYFVRVLDATKVILSNTLLDAYNHCLVKNKS